MTTSSVAYQQAMRDGHALAWELKWEAAIDRYRAALAESPDDIAARNSLALALQRIGRLAEALQEYRALHLLDPGDDGPLHRTVEICQRLGDAAQITGAHMELADHFYRQGQRVKAVDTWRRLAELLPEELASQERLYQAVAKAGESGLAGKIALTITKLRGAQAARGIIPALGQQIERAQTQEEMTDEGAILDPEAQGAVAQHIQAASNHLNAGRPEEALLSYASAATILRSAGARREIAELETIAGPLAEQTGGGRFADLLHVAEATRRQALEAIVSSYRQVATGHCLAAIDTCLAGIAMAPGYLSLQERLAATQAQMGAVAMAARSFTSLAQLYLLRGEHTPAVAALESASCLGATGGTTWDEVIGALLGAGMRAAALAKIVALAERYLDEGRTEEAVRQLERAAALAPDDAATLLRLGRAFEATGQLASASSAYRQVLHVERGNLDAALRLSVVAGREGTADAVEAALEVVLEAAARDGGAAAWVDSYREELSQSPECLALRLCYGAVLAKSGHWDEALAHLQAAAVVKGRLGAMARLWLGRYALEFETTEAAMRHLALVQRLVAERNPSERDAWRRVVVEFRRLWGEVCVHRGDLDKATAAFGELKRLAPKDADVYAQLAEVHFQRGEPRAAVAELLTLGDLLREEQQTDRALTVYHGAVQLVPEDPAPRDRLVETLLSLGKTDDALAAMDGLADVLAANGDNEAAASVLRQMTEHTRQSDPVHTLSLRQRVARLLPHDVEARQQLITSYMATGRSEYALSEASSLWRDLVASGHFREAMAALQQALQIDPWNAEALAGLGALHERLGEIDRAVETYRLAQAADPENKEIVARLATLVPSGNSGE